MVAYSAADSVWECIYRSILGCILKNVLLLRMEL
jgi:hypothetical protein